MSVTSISIFLLIHVVICIIYLNVRYSHARDYIAREFRLYMDFDILTGPLQPENSYV